MFQNYLKITLRNLWKHRSFSFLNIFGLAISMSVCLFIIMLVKNAYSFDKFHPESGRAYRILTDADRKEGRDESYASSPFMVGKTLTLVFSQVEMWTPLVRSFNGRMEVEGDGFNFDGLLTDSTFFEMFGFELASGDPATALNEPYTLVLHPEMAGRIFKDKNPLGATVQIPGFASGFRVTGVLKPFPGKTHMEFTALGSLSTQFAEEKLPDSSPVTSDWQDYYMTYNFVRLTKGADKKAAELALSDIAKTNYRGLELESRDAGYRFRLQPLDEITPGSNLSNTMGAGMPIFFIWFLTALGGIIMFSACFNYTNLTIARSLVRTKEVGVRKVLGASRWQVFGQFIAESVSLSVLALVLAYHLMKVIKPQFERLSITESLDIRVQEDLLLYGQFLLFAIAVGVVAGLLPALILSKTSPLAVLQKLQNVKLIRRVGFRKALLVTQFTFTLLFFIVTTIVWKQVNHSIATNFGFDRPQTLLVELQGQPFDKAATALGQVSGVENISGISHSMGTWEDGSDDVRTETNAEKKEVRDYFIDHRYLDHFGLKLVAGENFPDNPAQQLELFAIVNETFVKQFKLGEQNRDAVGKAITVGDSLQLTIRGVTEDFPFKPAVYAMEPLMLRYDPARLRVLNLEVATAEPAAVVTSLERSWNKLDPDQTFRAEFFDETVRCTYDEMLDLGSIVCIFGFLGMAIACMGLLGMAIYTVESKAKEISIRKIVGARPLDIVLQLSKGFLLLVGIAISIAVPVCYLLGSQGLQVFAERIPLSIGLFLPGVLLLLAATCLTVGSQTLWAALANPVKSLRSE